MIRILAVVLMVALLAGCGGKAYVEPPGGPPPVDSFVDPTATVAGDVRIGESVYVAPFATIQADAARQVRLESESDVQDNVTILAQAGDVVLGQEAIVAHGASIVGPVVIGGEAGSAFVGFNALVDGAIIEPGALVQAMARVGPGVVLPSGFKVRPGRSVSTQAEASDPALGKVEPAGAADAAFMDGVVFVNVDFAHGYAELERQSPLRVRGVGPNPSTLGDDLDLPTFAGMALELPSFPNRIIGQVEMEDSLKVLAGRLGARDSIRADEGHPIVMGTVAEIKDEVTFHALEHTGIRVGDGCTFGVHAVIHGGSDAGHDTQQTTIGNNVTVGDGAVVFRSTVGDNCVIGARALVDSCDLPAGTVVPDGVILINNQAQGTVEW